MKFKKGDKIICYKSNGHSVFREGIKCEIINIHREGMYMVNIPNYGHNLIDEEVIDNRFKLQSLKDYLKQKVKNDN